MHIQKIIINQFKNYEQQAFSFSPKINVIVGENGVGKTNLLDAIYYLCCCKSYFSTTDQQNIHHQQSFFRLDGHFVLTQQAEQITCKFMRQRKKEFSRNQIPYTKLSEHIGLLPIVMIAPDDIQLVKAGSEYRRKLINTTLAQLQPTYLKQLIQYNRLLQQRNTLLKKLHERSIKQRQSIDFALLNVYDDQLVPVGTAIFQQRKQFINALIPILQELYQYISCGKETVNIRYKSPINDTALTDLFVQNRQHDILLQRTTSGIHKDDLVFTIKDYPLKKFGSQGQQKSFLLALKLAIYQLLQQKRTITPILLLDDVFDKLDEIRTQQLIHIVSKTNFGQVFITDTQKKRMQALFASTEAGYKLYEL